MNVSQESCMTRLPRSAFARRARLYPRLMLRSVLRTERRVQAFSGETTGRRIFSRGVSALLFAWMSFMLMGNDSCMGHEATDTEQIMMDTIQAIAVGSLKAPIKTARPSRGQALHVSPFLTGTDGSQTGTASFMGDFTKIAPAQGNFMLARLNDCSLDLINAVSGAGSATVTPHYDQTLHQLASLKTTGGTFPNSCAARIPGVSSGPGGWIGETQGAVMVFAGVDQTGLFFFNSNNTLTEISETSLPYASAFATADLNHDGNGDLVVINGNGASSAFVSVVLGILLCQPGFEEFIQWRILAQVTEHCCKTNHCTREIMGRLF